jgi:hypothetical protein
MKNLSKNIILFILPFLIGTVLLFLIPVDKKFSYNFVKGECDNKASWIYHRIFENNDDIDIAFLGASHISCTVMDEYIENELNSFVEQGIKVANLGYCRGGRDIQFVMLKDLFQSKKPKVLVLEVMEDEPKKSHPVFPYLAESGDLWKSFIFFNQRYFTNIWKGIVVRFEQLKSIIFQTDNMQFNVVSDYGYLHSKQIASAEDLAQNKINWQERNSKSKTELLRNVELNYSKHYLQKIIKLAGQNNCKIMFLYLPESGSGLKTPLLTGYYKKFGELILLPDSIISNQLNWKDATHFNDMGAKKASEFIVNELESNY